MEDNIRALVLTLLILLKEHYSGGVITHHFLASDDMPGFSNWWGIISIPLLTWTILSLIIKSSARTNYLKNFLGALIFGITMSILWKFEFESILQYLILLPVALAFFIPIHFPEILLGFVLGMLYTFGGILPIVFGSVLMILCLFANKVIRKLRILLLSKRT